MMRDVKFQKQASDTQGGYVFYMHLKIQYPYDTLKFAGQRKLKSEPELAN